MKIPGILKSTAVVIGICASGYSLAENHVVVQKDKVFDTSELTIKVGDSVIFENHDPNAHNIYSRSADNSFDSGSLDPNETITIKFENPGSVRVRCAIHPKMKIDIIVTE